MNRWRIVVSYLDKPTRAVEFEDVYSLGYFQRRESSRCWHMEAPQRLLGPALSREEFEQGYRAEQRGNEWSVFEVTR